MGGLYMCKDSIPFCWAGVVFTFYIAIDKKRKLYDTLFLINPGSKKNVNCKDLIILYLIIMYIWVFTAVKTHPIFLPIYFCWTGCKDSMLFFGVNRYDLVQLYLIY
jgi:hypothetical protein